MPKKKSLRNILRDANKLDNVIDKRAYTIILCYATMSILFLLSCPNYLQADLKLCSTEAPWVETVF